MTLCSIECGHFTIINLKPAIESLSAAANACEITISETQELVKYRRIVSSCWRLEIGSILFLLSDAVIGLCKFGILTHSSSYQAFIMLTYILAQGLIVHSFVMLSINYCKLE
jgi:hypothetical protein